MTTGRFLIYGSLAVLLITAVKLFFILALNIDSIYIVYIFWVVIALVTIACSRRVGVISYLEAVFTGVVWLAALLVVDAIFVATIVGLDMYHHLYLWISYLLIIVCIFLFHKKRHVEIRKIQQNRP